MSTYEKKAVQNEKYLSYLSKELSCHAIEVYARRLGTSDENCKLKVHCYRALLELLIQERDTKLKHSALKSVRNCHLISFQDYANKATKQLNISFDFEDESLSKRIDSHLKEWWKVVIYYSLRLCFAPLIETAILLDRCLFLLEHGHISNIVPIFDPMLSPRNLVLLSMKLDK